MVFTLNLGLSGYIAMPIRIHGENYAFFEEITSVILLVSSTEIPK